MKFFNKYEYKIPKIWFHKIKGIEHVATSKELEISKGLTTNHSKKFLETRALVRQSLSTIFDLDPLAIPINANPGEPPELINGMGHVSFSHCNDAIAIVWHWEKIGVDIERLDRNFDYKKLAKKYFKNDIQLKFDKKFILERWCAIEAAIKWDHGKLSNDLKHWKYFDENKELIHKKKNLHLKLTQIKFYNWNITIVSKNHLTDQKEIICTSSQF